MADCGAAGSTIDRAAAAVIGQTVGSNNNDSVTKSMASFLGHASMSNAVAMPHAPPTALAMPSTTMAVPPPATNTTQRNPTMMNRAWNESSRPAIHHQQHNTAGPMMMQHHAHQMHMHPQQQMQMHHQHMRMQQHIQQQMMIQQQHHLHQHQQQLQARQTELQQQQTVQDAVQEQVEEHAENVTIDNWHEGILEDDDDVATVGHEGIVQGATIEELAKAWAEAEAEYKQEYADANHEAANLWTSPQAQDVLEQEREAYEFSEESREHPSDESIDWMARGMKEFEEGYTRKAVASFETELRHVDEDNATAWLMLGKCHAENDEDSRAIAALENAVDRDPYSTQALLALGVSYVNELNHERALDNLQKYITHNPQFAGMELASIENENPQDKVQRLLQHALTCCTGDDATAADVREALGVVYNVSRDYDKAIDCFRKALETHPDNYQLHNKLGATLANSNQSNDALHAYHDALQLKPRYARAWLNMAISHSNLSNYEDAARCYLQTLSLNPSATHCWSYLRIALSCCERWDLIPLAASRDLDGFREHYDFV